MNRRLQKPGTPEAGGAGSMLPLQLWAKFTISPKALHGKKRVENRSCSPLPPPNLNTFAEPVAKQYVYFILFYLGDFLESLLYV